MTGLSPIFLFSKAFNRSSLVLSSLLLLSPEDDKDRTTNEDGTEEEKGNPEDVKMLLLVNVLTVAGIVCGGSRRRNE